MRKIIQNKSGQTALIMILLAAAALIFYSITLNWGRIAQTKTVVSIAADQGASLLASYAASYGEMQKQQYLNNANRYSSENFMFFIDALIIAITIVIACFTFGASSPLIIVEIAVVVAVVMAVVTLVLQICVVGPMIENMWNKMQQSQPVYQQFFEDGVSTSFLSAVSDTVNITDYFDANTNAQFGTSNGLPTGASNDYVSRFAFFYSERMKMLNRSDVPQVALFYNGLGEFVNGNTCAQNESDHSANPQIPLSSACPGTCLSTDTAPDPTDPACQSLVPSTETCYDNAVDNAASKKVTGGIIVPLNPACPTNCTTSSPVDPECLTIMVSNPISFQLNDTCTDSDPTSSTYNPYCDPCCQIYNTWDAAYNPSNPNPYHRLQYKQVQPPSCVQNPLFTAAKCNATAPVAAQPKASPSVPGTPSYSPNNPDCVPVSCTGLNNPFSTAFPYLFDPTYQEYSNGVSFLDQFGRDQPLIPPPPPAVLPPALTNMTVEGNFPNGIYPFFWLMKDYSPEVDNIVPTTLQGPQVHWCTTTIPSPAGYVAPPSTTLAAFTDLDNLTLPLYTCTGNDCCVNFLASSLTAAGVPVSTSTINGPIDLVGSSTLIPAPAPNPSLNTAFGQPVSPPAAPPVNIWTEGDDQMCYINSSAGGPTWPYNGKTSTFPDGTCEWTNSNAAPAYPGKPPVKTDWPVYTTSSTMDNLDNVMHTLSDFAYYSNSLLSQNVASLNSSLSSWYPQAAAWFAPMCTANPNPYAGYNYTSGFAAACDVRYDAYCSLPDDSCNSDGNGRLLSIYNGISGTDVLKNWNLNVITPWLQNIYTTPSVGTNYPWCVPQEATLITDSNGTLCPANGKCSPGGKCSSDGSKCSPSEEDSFINTQTANVSTTWGDLPHVIACLNYNSGQIAGTTSTSGPTFGPLVNYQICLNNLTNTKGAIVCPATEPSKCLPIALGRALEPLPAADAYVAGSNCAFSTWVQDNITLFNDEAPKFALRAQFLNDIYTRAVTMQSILAQGSQALQNFLKPCTCGSGGTACYTNDDCPPTDCSSGPGTPPSKFGGGSCEGCTDSRYGYGSCGPACTCTGFGTCSVTTCKDVACGGWNSCADGGPAAQLMYARTNGGPTASFPNAVIYGWADNPTPSGQPGKQHIVKITAYSPGRDANLGWVLDKLPNIYMFTSFVLNWAGFFTAGFSEWYNWVLKDRDGYVYVDVKRWDEDHNPINFPNNHMLWQMMFQNPNRPNSNAGGNGIPSQCLSNYGGIWNNSATPAIGYGLMPQTVQGLQYQVVAGTPQIKPTDAKALANAFMLDDNGNGLIDPNPDIIKGSAGSASETCVAGNTSQYCSCLSWANQMLSGGTESHACAQYIAWRNASSWPSSASEQPDFWSFDTVQTAANEADYSLKFVDCNYVDGGKPPDDQGMAYQLPGS